MISYSKLYEPQDEPEDDYQTTKMKMVIVMASHLKMGRGKEIAQGGHAVMGAYNDSMWRWGPIGGDMSEAWEENGKKKVCLKVYSEDEIVRLAMLCEAADIGHYLVRDAGRTEVAPMSATALGIGPDYEHNIDRITGELALY